MFLRLKGLGSLPTDAISMFVSGFLLSLSLCLDLGIVNIAAIKAGLENGFLPSLLLGLGSAIGDLIYASASLTVLSLITESKVVRMGLWIFGTLALTYLTWHMLRETVNPHRIRLDHQADAPPARPTRRLGWFAAGIGLALASPSAILWFVTVGGSVIASTGSHHHTVADLISFNAGFLVAGSLWSCMVAYVSNRVRRLIRGRVIRFVSLLSAALLFYFACRVFVQGLSLIQKSH